MLLILGMFALSPLLACEFRFTLFTQTLSTGRPPAFDRSYIDCLFPQDSEMKLSKEGNMEPGCEYLLCCLFNVTIDTLIHGVGNWGFRFALECVAEVAAKTLTATPPRYSDILELDRKIREFAMPSDALDMLRGGPDADPRNVPLPASMISFVLSHTKEVSTYIHTTSCSLWTLNFGQSCYLYIEVSLRRR